LPRAAPYETISLAINRKLLKAVLAAVDCPLCNPQKMTIRPPEYKPPPRRAYTDLGWIFAALTGPATLLKS
jgi:hypothetical protein